jgi:hypothetical protein
MAANVAGVFIALGHSWFVVFLSWLSPSLALLVIVVVVTVVDFVGTYDYAWMMMVQVLFSSFSLFSLISNGK